MALNFNEVISQSRKELDELLRKRDSIDKRIAQLNKALRGLAPMLPPNERSDLEADLYAYYSRKPHGLTEMILSVLREGGIMTANQVRKQLEDSGIDLSEYSQPLAAVMNTLNRLKKSGRVKKVPIKSKEILYEWVRDEIHGS